MFQSVSLFIHCMNGVAGSRYGSHVNIAPSIKEVPHCETWPWTSGEQMDNRQSCLMTTRKSQTDWVTVTTAQRSWHQQAEICHTSKKDSHPPTTITTVTKTVSLRQTPGHQAENQHIFIYNRLDWKTGRCWTSQLDRNFVNVRVWTQPRAL